MAKKSLEHKIDALTSIVEKGFAKHDKELKDLTESVAHVVKHMLTKEDGEKFATKDQVYSVQTQVSSIEQQLRETRIGARLGDLEEKVFGAPRR
jgi:hypothetical protein